MDQNVADMLARLERERPADPEAAVRSWSAGDERLAERVLQLLSEDGTREVSSPEAEDLPVAPAGSPPEDRTLDAMAPTTNAPLPSGAGSSHGSRGSRSGTGSGSTTSRFRRPDRIGPFRIEGQVPLGRGGFGEVWEAVRVDGGFKQRVAIKVISRATPDERMVRRFELERQVLASLDHPDIARLIDGGELDDGRPWLAMEFIEGS